MLATRYHLPPPQVTADNNDQPQLVDAEEVYKHPLAEEKSAEYEMALCPFHQPLPHTR